MFKTLKYVNEMQIQNFIESNISTISLWITIFIIAATLIISVAIFNGIICFFFFKRNNINLLTQARVSEFVDKLLPGDIIINSKISFEPGCLLIRIANFFKLGYEERIWTHVAIYTGKETVNGKVIERIIEALPGEGVKESDLGSYFNGDYDIAILRKVSDSPDKLVKAVTYCKSLLKSKENKVNYDGRALYFFPLLIIFPPCFEYIAIEIDKALDEPNAYFCSELIAEALEDIKEYGFDREPDKIMPVDFYNSPSLKKIDEIKGDVRHKLIELEYFLISVIVFLIVPFLLIGIPIIYNILRQKKPIEQEAK